MGALIVAKLSTGDLNVAELSMGDLNPAEWWFNSS